MGGFSLSDTIHVTTCDLIIILYLVIIFVRLLYHIFILKWFTYVYVMIPITIIIIKKITPMGKIVPTFHYINPKKIKLS